VTMASREHTPPGMEGQGFTARTGSCCHLGSMSNAQTLFPARPASHDRL
jgi:hypothetical protein